MSKQLVADEEMQNRRRAGSDPTRLRMWELFQLRGEWTAKELAAELRVPANRLYYHLRLLESVGAIEVVGTRAPGRMVERVYAPTKAFDRVTWNVNEPSEQAIHLFAILDAAKVGGEDALYERARQTEAGEEPLFITYARPSISGMRREEVVEFYERLMALDKEFRKRRDDREDGRGKFPPGSIRLKYAYVIYGESVPQWLSQHEGIPDDEASN